MTSRDVFHIKSKVLIRQKSLADTKRNKISQVLFPDPEQNDHHASIDFEDDKMLIAYPVSYPADFYHEKQIFPNAYKSKEASNNIYTYHYDQINHVYLSLVKNILSAGISLQIPEACYRLELIIITDAHEIHVEFTADENTAALIEFIQSKVMIEDPLEILHLCKNSKQLEQFCQTNYDTLAKKFRLDNPRLLYPHCEETFTKQENN